MKDFSDTFHVRSYLFNELAMLYFPHVAKYSATKQLKRWIRINPALCAELERLSWPSRHARLLTPLQVLAIVTHLGEP